MGKRSNKQKYHVRLEKYVKYYQDTQKGIEDGRRQFMQMSVARTVSIICLTCSNIYSILYTIIVCLSSFQVDE